MISELQPLELPLNLNQEITDHLEKTWTKTTFSSKDQHDKTINAVIQFYLQLLSTHLNYGNSSEITDLIIDKSIQISEHISNFDWPNPETLKVPNLHRMAPQFYFYVKNRLNFLISKNKKQPKDQIKASENIVNMLNTLLDSPVTNHLQSSLLYLLFKDLFSLYVLSNYNPSIKDEILGIVDTYKMETNIEGLAKMNSIDEKAQMNFFLGTLAVILQLKVKLAGNNAVIPSDLNQIVSNIITHEKILTNICFLASAELAWIDTCIKFTNGQLNVNDFKRLKDLIDIGRVYTSFIRATSSKFIDIINYITNLLRTEMIIILVYKQVKLTENILSALMYDQNQYEMDMIMSSSITNISPIKKLLKIGINGLYHDLKFHEKILGELSKSKESKDENGDEYRNALLSWGLDKDAQPQYESEKYLSDIINLRKKKFEL